MSEQQDKKMQGAVVFNSADPRDNKENFLNPPTLKKDSKKAKPKDSAKETQFSMVFQTPFLWGLKTNLQRAMWLHVLKHPNDSPEQMHRDTSIAANSFRNFLRREDVRTELSKIGGDILKMESPLFVAAIKDVAEKSARGSFKHQKLYTDLVLRRAENTKSSGGGNITVKLLSSPPKTTEDAADDIEEIPDDTGDTNTGEPAEEDSEEDY